MANKKINVEPEEVVKVEETPNNEEDLEKTKNKTRKLSAEEEQKTGNFLTSSSLGKSQTKEIEQKRKSLLEKAAKLKEKLSKEAPKTEELKEQVKGKKKGEMLVPLDEYVKSGIYIGTKVVTPLMRPFVYRRRADGLAIFNTDLIDEKLKEGIEYLSKFDAKDIILVCKREAGWKAVEKFGELTGIRVFSKKYPAGILTNTQLAEFFENELTIVCDSWLDKNALHDTLNVHKKVLMVCDTNNFPKGANQIIIGNNKSEKSLGLIFYLLARGYMKAKNEQKTGNFLTSSSLKEESQTKEMDTSKIPDLEWWTGDLQESPKFKRKIKAVEHGV